MRMPSGCFDGTKSRREKVRLVLIGGNLLDEDMIRRLLKAIRLKVEAGDLD